MSANSPHITAKYIPQLVNLPVLVETSWGSLSRHLVDYLSSWRNAGDPENHEGHCATRMHRQPTPFLLFGFNPLPILYQAYNIHIWSPSPLALTIEFMITS